MVSWSDPNPQGITPAQATMHSQINPINMSAVVSAIIEHQRLQQAQQQQYQRDIQQGLQAYQQYQQQGQADDAANRAMYMAQNPGGDIAYDANGQPYHLTGPDLDNRVPDYGGVAQMRANQAEQQLQGGTPDQRALTLAKIAAAMRAGVAKPMTAGQQAVADRAAYHNQLNALNDQIDETGYDPNDILNAKQIQYAGTDPQMATMNGMYRVGQPQGAYTAKNGEAPYDASNDYSNLVPADRYNQMLALAKQRQALLQQSTTGGVPVDGNGQQSGPAPGTTGTVNGSPAVYRNGSHGWGWYAAPQ